MSARRKSGVYCGRVVFCSVIVASVLMAGGVAMAQSQLSGRVKVDGSSTVAPITMAAAELFQAEQPRVRVTVGISGTGGGFDGQGPPGRA